MMMVLAFGISSPDSIMVVANKVSEKNAILQIKILLNSLGLNEDEINRELNNYLETTKNSHK